MAAKKAEAIMNYEGLIPAPFSPFTPDGELNTAIIPQYVDHLVSQGVKGVYINGTTGEGLLLTVKERKAAAEAWVKHGKGKLDVIIVHVGANSVKDAQEMASHAEKIGATGIAALPPLFYKPLTHDHLIYYFKQIASAAPETPLMLYHFPAMSSVEITLGEFLPEARKAIPTFIGAKYTSVDARDLLKCTSVEPKLKMLSGYEEVLLPSIASGVTAAVGANYSFMAPLSLKIIDAFKKGKMEEAREYQNRVTNINQTITRHGQAVACYKATMNLVGPLNVGLPRAPLIPLSPKALVELEKDLKKLKSDEWRKL